MVVRRLPWYWSAASILAVGCSSSSSGPAPSASAVISQPPSAPQAGLVALDELDRGARAWIDTTLSSMDDVALAAQLVIPWISGAYTSRTSSEFTELAEWVELGIGGVSISIGLPHSYADKLNQLQLLADVPLLVTSDFENGGPGMRLNHTYAIPSLLPQGGGTSFPPTMAFGAIGDEDAAFEYGRITASEARAVGVHVVFAPVLDVNSNPLNPVINTRSFGEDPDAVARLGTSFMRGLHAGGTFSTAKHFPGHGDTDVDSHIALPVIMADRARLDAVDLVPFQAAVDGGVDAVMTAHVAMPTLLGEDALPATLAPELMTGLLREQMGFRGLLITDALRMGAITGAYGAGEAGVLALEAGSDVLLAPADVAETVEAVVAAIASGRLARSRVEASVKKILEFKTRAGLHERRSVDLDLVSDRVGTGEHLAVADTMASRSMTLPRDRQGLVPMDLATTRRVLAVTWARQDDLLAGTTFNPLLARYVEHLDRVRVGPDTDEQAYADLAGSARGYDQIVISAYVPPRSGAGSVAAPPAFADFVGRVDRSGSAIVISFGSPYLLGAFPDLGTYLVAWGDREVSQRAAVRALVGRTAISGRMPVSIPPVHEIGAGLDRPARAVTPRTAGDPLVEAGMVAAPGGQSQVVPVVGAVVECMARSGSQGAANTGMGRCPRTSTMTVSRAESDPAGLGMDGEALERVDRIILQAIGDGATPGAALAVGRHGRLVRLRGYGQLDWDDEADPAGPRSIWDLASLTKVVATTTSAMILVDEGLLDLDQRVVTYLPWWDEGDPSKATVTVRQLLLHRAGLPPFRRFYLEMDGGAAYRDAIGREPLVYVPGDSTVYSDIGLMTIGFIVEEISGESLDDFARSRVWQRLGMTDTDFTPDSEWLTRIPPTEVDTTYRHTHVHGTVHDENAYAMGGVAGHAGLFSSTTDLAVFAQVLLDTGMASCPERGVGRGACIASVGESSRLIDSSTVRAFTTRYDTTASRALGWDTPSGRSSAGDYFTPEAFGHTGYTGTSLWIDPARDLYVILLTARVNPTRDNNRHVALRRSVHDAIALAITDMTVERREPF